jgi:23S rRNA pseudouridine1911/1915/1917 synthase
VRRASRITFVADEGDKRLRLDRLVVIHLERAGHPASRAVVQRWIDEGRVLVDGAPGRSSQSVSAGSVVEVDPSPPEPTRASPDPSVVLDIVYEDAHLVVVDKPAGLVVHPAAGHPDRTLVNGLLALGGFERGDGEEGHFRPGIVHRLDKGTSGLLVVARDEATREALKAQFAAHTIEREYVALVVGRAESATYDTLHGRHPSDRLRFTTQVRRGRRAVTHVQVVERLAQATVVRCRLETGRTHQIRVHLAEAGGTPVLGDPVYGRPPRDPVLRRLAEELGHQALHARVLGIVHPATGQAMRWESPLPADMRAAIDELRVLAKERAPDTRR